MKELEYEARKRGSKTRRALPDGLTKHGPAATEATADLSQTSCPGNGIFTGGLPRHGGKGANQAGQVVVNERARPGKQGRSGFVVRLKSVS